MMITFDFETKSEADLKKVGAWAYAEHPSTDVICACWVVDDNPVESWWPGKYENDEIPRSLLHALARDLPMSKFAGDRKLIQAHGAGFEQAIWHYVTAKKYGWPEPAPGQWRCTMSVCYYYALPAALDRVSTLLGFGGKNPKGAALISKYSKLNLKTAKHHIPDHEWITWKDMTATQKRDNPDAKAHSGFYCEDFADFVEYCADDVRQEKHVGDYLGTLDEVDPVELEIWLLDQEINRRGIPIDLFSVRNAIAVVEEREEELTHEFNNITGLNPGQRDKIIAWFTDQGLILDNLQAEYLESVLQSTSYILTPGDIDLPRRALEIRVQINKASTKKLYSMLRQVNTDSRARYQAQYHGATTGRDTGRGFQPLNLDKGYDKVNPDQLIHDINRCDPKWLDLVYGDATEAVGKAARHFIKAKPGHDLISGDFASIEAVILACIAGEAWKVKAFHEGAKIYELMADKIYKLPPGTVTKATHPEERADGKIGELACGYQGGLKAWRKFDPSDRHTDERVMEIVRMWRDEHPMTTTLWENLNAAAMNAVHYGKPYEVRGVEFEVVDEWLSMRGLNGKRIWYYNPQIKLVWPAWHAPGNPEEHPECADGTCGHEKIVGLTYEAQKDGHWHRVSTYGGKLAENLVQFMSREILVPAIKRVSEAGYPVILRVYDEIVAEVPKGFGSEKEFRELMEVRPKWARDWPISAGVWRGERFRK